MIIRSRLQHSHKNNQQTAYHHPVPHSTTHSSRPRLHRRRGGPRNTLPRFQEEEEEERPRHIIFFLSSEGQPAATRSRGFQHHLWPRSPCWTLPGRGGNSYSTSSCEDGRRTWAKRNLYSTSSCSDGRRNCRTLPAWRDTFILFLTVGTKEETITLPERRETFILLLNAGTKEWSVELYLGKG